MSQNSKSSAQIKNSADLPEKIISTSFHHKLGSSVLGQPIGYFSIGSGKKSILLMSGLHGDGIEGPMLLNALFREFMCRPFPEKIREEWSIIILPMANPDGFNLRQRWNYNLVDLNRNFPTFDWQSTPLNLRYPPGPTPASEPETNNIMTLIKNHFPMLVVDIHSYKTSAVLPCFPSEKTPVQTQLYSSNWRTFLEKLNPMIDDWAQALQVPIGDEVLGYVTAGGKHTWCQELGIPEITLEVEKNKGYAEVVERYLNPTLNFLCHFMTTV